MINSNKTSRQGQTALIMILLTAAALIFLAITMNWGRVAQTKSLVTIAADEATSLLASDAASYGEMQKQTYLQNKNEISSLNGMIMALIAVVVAIICLIITITTAGAGSPVWAALAIVLAVLSVVMALVNLALQICVVQPGITALWNKMQKQQTIQQQFVEGGMSTALQGSVTDQVNMTDYFDLNTNGNFGSTGAFSNDTVGRFAFFYTERLRMLNQTTIPEITFFRQQLDDFINGETCGENAKENTATPGMGINFNCSNIGAGKECMDPGNSDPACESPIPDSLQLNDSCTDSSPSSPNYNPSCDVCCQPLVINSTPSDPTPTYQSLRPTSCYPYANGGSYPSICFSKPNKSECGLTQLCSTKPNDPACLFGGSSSSGECSTNNPYDSISPPKTYPYIYDASYQEYSNQTSFLDQYGRDRRYALTGEPPFSSLVLQGEFPNGIYPYFWLLKNYALEVDTLTTANFPPNSSSPGLHWCSAATSSINGINIGSFTAPSGFPDISQLTLSYACQSQDCCVNYLPDSLSQNAVNSNSIALTSTAGVMSVAISQIIVTPATGAPVTYANPSSVTLTDDALSIEVDITATEVDGTIQTVTLNNNTKSIINTLTGPPYMYLAKPPFQDGMISITATATDSNNNTMTSSAVSIAITAALTGHAQASPSLPAQAKAKPAAKAATPAPAAFAQPAGSPLITISVTPDTGSSYTVTGGAYNGSGSVTITATVTGGSLAQITFYAQNTADDSVTALGTATASPYQVDWTPSGGSYTIFAVGSSTKALGGALPSSGATVNGNIDIVGNPTLTTNPKTASPIANPVSDDLWGYNPGLNNTWTEGDNQMCVPDWPYNGRSLSYDDGSCEWTNAPPPGPGVVLTEKTTSVSTIDRVDDVMHTLSGFDVFAGSVLNKDEETLNKTFDAWYAQASQWIAPSCDPPTSTPACSQTEFDNPINQNCGVGANTACNPYCARLADITSAADTACHKGGDGRLLSIYEPTGYPGVAGVISYQGTTVDKLKDWNDLITGWLNNTYANDSAWCVPTQPTLQTKASSDICSDGAVCPWSGTCKDGHACTPSEVSYINAKSFTTQWGDLPHVIACLNYNAGPITTPASNYQQCLSELQSVACPTIRPQDCPPTYDAATACNINSVGGYASWLSNNSNLASNPLYQQCLSALTSASPCPSEIPPVCAPIGSAPSGKWSTASPVWRQRCSADYQGSYANWVSDQINYGPIYNYTNCATLLAGSCPANATALNSSVCAPAVLGRSLESGPPAFGNSTTDPNRCKPTVAGSYAHWIQDNIVLFTDEQPKFLARSSFLTDLYSQAQTMQSIFVQADAGLHSFLKPCLQCAYVTTCGSDGLCPDKVTLCGPPSCADGSMCTNGECSDGTPCLPAGQCAMTGKCSGGKCDDGSACGAAPSCADGGPAARLMYRREVGNPTASLPNSVIYGWTDNVPTGHMGGCTDNGANVGCAHIVKVSAYSPARNGTGPAQAGFVSPILPWINTWETFFLRKYALANRDGYVYVGVRRWDQDHAGTGYFPNGRRMWQFVYHNPSTGAEGTGGLPTSCMGVPLGGTGSCAGGPGCFGYGLMQNTAAGLKFAQISSQDQTALGNAFMLNDNGNGQVDASLGTGSSCKSGSGSSYCTCLSDANKLLNSGVESHACAEYIASTNATGPSGNDDSDYSLKFVDCNQLGHPEDLTFTQ